jgi:hypothetical protein
VLFCMKLLGRDSKRVFSVQLLVGSEINLISLFMKKYLFVFFILINISCKNENKLLALNDKKAICKSADILNLDETFQDNFIYKIDSVRKIQYPNGREDKEIFVDFDKKMLSQFLKDINQKEFYKNNTFEKEYHFNIAPRKYSDPEICKDKISIEFFSETCVYCIRINNTFLVPDNWCTESEVIYYFDLKNGKIDYFNIQQVG